MQSENRGVLRDEGVLSAFARVSGLRPYEGALVESQSLPTLVYGEGGVIEGCNRAAAELFSTGADGQRRLVAHDGTDLWTIVSARQDEAHPFFDIRLKIRLADGEIADATMAVAPLRAAGGELGGALVFVIDLPGERLRAERAIGAPGISAEARATAFQEIVEYIGGLTDADYVYVAEIDPDFGDEAYIHAAWERGRGQLPPCPGSGAGTPMSSFAGRRLLCVPHGAAEAFPDDTWIAAEGYDAFIGVALSDPAGRRIGVLGALWRSPVADVAGTSAALRVVGVAAAEVLAAVLAERDLKESEQRYAAVFQGSSVPMLLIDPESTQIVDANPAACTFYGYSRDELMTMSAVQIDDHQADLVQAEIRQATEGARTSRSGRHRTAAGAIRDVEVDAGPISIGGRPLIYYMVHDVTERRRMELELESHKRELERIVEQRTEDLLRANAELQQASVARDMVFASLTQELRTSLQTITGFSELLLEGMAGELNEEQARQMRMVLEAGKRLSGFVAGLIETHRLESASLTCEPEEFELVSLVESVVFGLGPFAEEKGLTLTVDVGERPIDVYTDHYKLQKILLNLLSNAVRYTERGGVNVYVTRVSDTVASIAVADTGPGMTAEEVAAAFEGPDAHTPASGIGLPASRRLAEVLGGTLSADSVPGRGSVFTLMLPVVCAPEPGAADAEARSDE
jgi:PAS domain S-box-containing protein